jgi:hypothetical protein
MPIKISDSPASRLKFATSQLLAHLPDGIYVTIGRINPVTMWIHNGRVLTFFEDGSGYSSSESIEHHFRNYEWEQMPGRTITLS